MKTSWSIDYLNKTYGNYHPWAQRKLKEYKRKYGTEFGYRVAHGRLVILAILDFKKNPMILDGYHSDWEAEMADDISSYIPERKLGLECEGITFVKLAETSGWQLQLVLDTCKFLIKVQGYQCLTNRMGKCVGIKR
jgi:hypothetical protein